VPVALPEHEKADVAETNPTPPAKPVVAPARATALPPAMVQGSKTAPSDVTQANSGITRAAKADDETTVFYSMYSRQAGQQGNVRLSVVVLPDGMPGQVRVLTSSGYQELDNLARNNVMLWHFEPAMKDGVPVESVLVYVFKFALQ
jgi:protein TonB